MESFPASFQFITILLLNCLNHVIRQEFPVQNWLTCKVQKNVRGVDKMWYLGSAHVNPWGTTTYRHSYVLTLTYAKLLYFFPLPFSPTISFVLISLFVCRKPFDYSADVTKSERDTVDVTSVSDLQLLNLSTSLSTLNCSEELTRLYYEGSN